MFRHVSKVQKEHVFNKRFCIPGMPEKISGTNFSFFIYCTNYINIILISIAETASKIETYLFIKNRTNSVFQKKVFSIKTQIHSIIFSFFIIKI